MNAERRRVFHNPPPVERLPRAAPRDAVKIDFAKRLQAAMTRKGWNQSETARRAAAFTDDRSFGRDNISVYVRGLSLPGPAHLAALARALGVKPEELLPSRGVPSAEDRAPPLDIKDAGDGLAWLKINQAVEWSVAVKIMQLLKGDE